MAIQTKVTFQDFGPSGTWLNISSKNECRKYSFAFKVNGSLNGLQQEKIQEFFSNFSPKKAEHFNHVWIPCTRILSSDQFLTLMDTFSRNHTKKVFAVCLLHSKSITSTPSTPLERFLGNPLLDKHLIRLIGQFI